MSLISEFKEFAARGNVVDLAVGVIIGGAFGNIVTSLEWILVPENPATEAVEKVAIQYGAFINTLIQFLIVAFVVFLLVKGINKLRRERPAEPAAPAAPTATEALLAEIRDELKSRR